MIVTSSCVNARDNDAEKTNTKGSCATRLRDGTTTCQQTKGCDSSCNLCACSTASGTTKEHCNGHGTCEASCTALSCTDAKCKCHSGWTGAKCESGLCINLSFNDANFMLQIIIISKSIQF